MPRRVTRLAVAAVGAAAVATLLSACSKPLPDVTVLANRVVTRLAPRIYCFDDNPKHCHARSGTQTIEAAPGSTIIVDVPRVVATQHWTATAFTTDTTGKATTLDANSSAVVQNTHTVRLGVPQVSTGSYEIEIKSTQNGTTKTGQWDVVVKLAGGA